MKDAYDPEVEGQYCAFVLSGVVHHRWHLNKLWLFELAGIKQNDLILDADCGVGNVGATFTPQ